MGYEIMKCLCMFDLPMETKKEQKEYREFRKRLLESGFTMVQFSIYVRTCPNRDYMKLLERQVRMKLPCSGNVRLLLVTEKQYNDMLLLVGSKTATEEALGEERFIIL